VTPEIVILIVLGAPLGVTASVTLGVAFTVLLAQGWGRRDAHDEHQAAAFADKRAGVVSRVWWLGVEGVLTTVAFGSMPLHAALRRRRLRLSPGEGGTPVLLTAGYLENGVHMWLLARRLRARGFRVAVLDLPNTLRPIADNVEVMREAALELMRETGAEQVALVGHSMGGVIGRALVHTHADVPVACVVSIASPHRGTHMAKLGPGRSARDMSQGSEHALAHPPERRGSAPVHCVVGFMENIVSPNASAILNEGESVVLDVPAPHLAPLVMPSVAELTSRWLTEAGVQKTVAAQPQASEESVS
jgi:pimeloyl-ACP methyl ester carboxylesterase